MRVTGIDENGLGPLLGPLVATSVTLDLRRYDPRRGAALAESLGVGDSKAVSAFRSMAGAESLALAVVESLTGRVPESADDVLAALSIDGILALRGPCPRSSAPHCWAELALPAFGGEVETGRAILAGLAKKKITLTSARTVALCVSLFNREVARCGSKFSVDLELFERLILTLPRDGQQQIIAGMVGGIRAYGRYFERLLPLAPTVIEEGRKLCRYTVPTVGEVAFEVDADATHLPVSLASMIGKYVRELWMERQNRFFMDIDPSLKPASGYHDPVTRRLVAATELVRRERHMGDDCFLRQS